MSLWFLLAASIFIFALTVAKAAKTLPLTELRRRARRGQNRQASALYKLVAHGKSAEILLNTIGAFSFAALILLAASKAWWLGLAVFLAGSLVVSGWRIRTGDFAWKLATSLAPVISAALSYIQPVVGRLGDWLERRATTRFHTGIYEKEDLLELINSQDRQVDNKVDQQDLTTAAAALTFGDKTVADVMTPRRKLKMVSDQDPIGPVLMDELHASGFRCFPVVSGPAKAASPTIIGTLYLGDLVGYEGDGKVASLMKRQVYFINEDMDLRQALDAFLKTQNPTLVVVNNFEEVVGLLTLEDVLKQAVDRLAVDEFDKYDDLAAVAAMTTKKDHKPSKPKSPEQT
ncbi:MAG: CBS domain-containing protein [Candidatus Saccharimonadales bacterium]